MAKLVLYRVTAATGLALAAGTLVGLTSALQLDRFRWALEGVDPKAGVWRLTQPVTFKRGEEVGLEGEIPKAQAQVAEPVKPRRRSAAGDSQPGGAAGDSLPGGDSLPAA